MFKFKNGNTKIQKMYTTFDQAILHRQKLVIILVFNYMIGLLCIEILQKIHESSKQNLTPCTVKKVHHPMQKCITTRETKFHRENSISSKNETIPSAHLYHMIKFGDSFIF